MGYDTGESALLIFLSRPSTFTPLATINPNGSSDTYPSGIETFRTDLSSFPRVGISQTQNIEDGGTRSRDAG